MPTLLNNLGPVALGQSLLLEVLLQVLINSKNSSTRKPSTRVYNNLKHTVIHRSVLLENILKMKANDA